MLSSGPSEQRCSVFLKGSSQCGIALLVLLGHITLSTKEVKNLAPSTMVGNILWCDLCTRASLWDHAEVNFLPRQHPCLWSLLPLHLPQSIHSLRTLSLCLQPQSKALAHFLLLFHGISSNKLRANAAEYGIVSI